MGNLTRRTRLDVHDKTIRKILNQKLAHGNGSHFSGGRSSVWTVILLLVLIGLNGVIVFQTDLLGWLSKPSATPIKAEAHSPSPSTEPAATSPASTTAEGLNSRAETPAKTETPPASQTPIAQTTEPEPEPVPRKIQVEVLNGCGVSGLARRTMRILRKAGFDVVKTDNYKTSNVRQTFIIDRVGNKAKAEKLAQALGIPSKRIRTEKDPSLALDVTLVLGKDYRQLKIFKK